MENDIQLVACSLDNEEYGIDIRNVQEIIRLLDITRVPHASPYMAGVVNLRGMVIPVMNIRKRFGMPEKEPQETTRIVIVSWNGSPVGIIVDSVSEVIRLERKNIESPPTCSQQVNQEFFTGIGKQGKRLLIMLNLGKVLNINSDNC